MAISSLPTRAELVKECEYLNNLSLLETVSDIHIRKLREEIRDWKGLMKELGLEEHEIHFIDLQEPTGTMKRHMGLRKWKKKHGRSASYLSFLDACMKTRDIKLAKAMLKLLNQHHEEKLYNKSHGKKERKMKTFSDSSYDETDQDLLSSSDCSTMNSSLLETAELATVTMQQRLGEIKESYAKMIQAISTFFKSKVPHEEVLKSLDSVPYEFKPLPEYRHIMSCDERNKISELIKITHYRYTELLEHLVNELGDDACKAAMSAYQIDLIHFSDEAALSEYTDTLLGGNYHRENEIVLTVGETWEVKTVRDLDHFIKKMSRKALFNQYDMRLQRAELRFQLLMLVLVSEDADVSKLSSIEIAFFRNNNVLRATSKGKIIYDAESLKNFEFIEPVSPFYFCPIKKHIMADPHKMQCCGKYISKQAIQDILDDGKPCPFCMATTIEYKLDQNLREKVRMVRVKCPHKYEGCHWSGEIRHLKKHLHGEEDRSCKFALIACPSACGVHLQRFSVEKHLQICPIFNKQLKCQHCGEMYSQTSRHWETCTMLPVHCPYKCGAKVTRVDIISHLKECPKLQIDSHQKHENDDDEQIDTGESPKVSIPDDLGKTFQEREQTSNEELSDRGAQLLEIAKKLLQARSQLPDVRIKLMYANFELIMHQIEAFKGQSGKDKTESEFEEKGSELKNKEVQLEDEMAQLRYELLETHNLITKLRSQ